jgi:transcriptional regulator with XRE-family HTH domain
VVKNTNIFLDNINSTINQRLREYIHFHGISDRAFAEMIDVDKSNLSRVLNLKAPMPSEWLFRLLKLQPPLNIEWLIKGAGEMLKGEESEKIMSLLSEDLPDTLHE